MYFFDVGMFFRCGGVFFCSGGGVFLLAFFGPSRRAGSSCHHHLTFSNNLWVVNYKWQLKVKRFCGSQS